MNDNHEQTRHTEIQLVPFSNYVDLVHILKTRSTQLDESEFILLNAVGSFGAQAA